MTNNLDSLHSFSFLFLNVCFLFSSSFFFLLSSFFFLLSSFFFLIVRREECEERGRAVDRTRETAFAAGKEAASVVFQEQKVRAERKAEQVLLQRVKELTNEAEFERQAKEQETQRLLSDIVKMKQNYQASVRNIQTKEGERMLLVKQLQEVKQELQQLRRTQVEDQENVNRLHDVATRTLLEQQRDKIITFEKQRAEKKISKAVAKLTAQQKKVEQTMANERARLMQQTASLRQEREAQLATIIQKTKEVKQWKQKVNDCEIRKETLQKEMKDLAEDKRHRNEETEEMQEKFQEMETLLSDQQTLLEKKHDHNRQLQDQLISTKKDEQKHGDQMNSRIKKMTELNQQLTEKLKFMKKEHGEKMMELEDISNAACREIVTELEEKLQIKEDLHELASTNYQTTQEKLSTANTDIAKITQERDQCVTKSKTLSNKIQTMLKNQHKLKTTFDKDLSNISAQLTEALADRVRLREQLATEQQRHHTKEENLKTEMSRQMSQEMKNISDNHSVKMKEMETLFMQERETLMSKLSSHENNVDETIASLRQEHAAVVVRLGKCFDQMFSSCFFPLF